MIMYCTPKGIFMDRVKEILQKINIHIVFAAVFLLIIGVIVFRLNAWNNRSYYVEPNEESAALFDRELLDSLVPYTYDAEPKDPEDMIIACFGNAPFADDMGTSSNLAEIIADKTGATVYNFAFADSYLSCANPTLDTSSADFFSLYWLTTIFTLDNDTIVNGFLTNQPNASLEVKAQISLLQNLDFNDVDVIAIMYDGSDYLANRGMYNNDDNTNIQHFGGALRASIELIREYFPHIQIIVLSPTYAYALAEDGSYLDSTITTYDEGPLASYVQYECNVCYETFTTFIDVFYGAVSVDEADEYLIDNIHLTEAARELIADRFMTGYEYYLKRRNQTN